MANISTDRLKLLPYNYSTPESLMTMVGWLNDPENVRYSEQRHKKHDTESQKQYISDGPDIFREIHARAAFGTFIVGTISAYIDRNNSVADVGILIGKSSWGKGYGYEAWAGFCDHLLNNGIRKIEAGTAALNYGMVRIFQKYRMFREGHREAHFLIGTQLVDLIQFGKFHD